MNKLKSILFATIFSVLVNSIYAVTYYSWPASGSDPSNLNNWWTVNNGTGSHPANFTTAGDNFTIQATHTVTATAAWTVTATVTLTAASSTLDMATFALSVGAISNTGLIKTQCTGATPLTTGLTWAGTVQYNATSGGQTIMAGTYATLILSNTSGTNTASGNLVVNTALTTTAGGTLDISTYTLTGTITTITNPGIIKTACITNPPFTASKNWGTGTVEFSALNGGQYIPLGTYNTLILDNTSGTNTAVGALTVTTLTTTAGGTLDLVGLTLTVTTVNHSGILRLTGGALPTGKTWGGTVEYYATGAQALSTGTYNNLTISGTGTKTAGGTVTVNGTLTTSAATDILAMAGNQLLGTLTGISNTGTISSTNTTNPPIPAGKTWGGTVIYGAAKTVAGGTYNNLSLSGSATHTAGAAITVNGTLTTSAAPDVLDMSTFQLLGTITVSNTGTIKTGCTSNPPIPTGLTWNGIVQYTVTTGGQTVADGTYDKLTVLNTSGTNTASGAVVVNTLLTTTASGTFDMSTYTLTGTLTTITNNGTIKTSCTTNPPIASGKTWTGTVQYALLTGGQSVPAGTFATLTFSNTSGTNTAVGNFVVNTALNTTAGGTLDMSTFTLTGTLTTITNNGTVKTACTTNPPYTANKTWGGSGTVEFTVLGGGQSIPQGTYATLLLDNTSGTNTVVTGAINVTTFTTTAGGTTDMATFQLLTGTTINHSGILKTQNTTNPPIPLGKTWGGTVEYNANAGQSVANGTYNILTLSTGGTKTLLTPSATVNNTFTVGTGATFADGGFVLTAKANVVMTGAHTGAGSITLSGGSAPHDLSGTGTYFNLITNDAQGATLSTDITVNGTLTLTNGLITLGANDLNLSATTSALAGTPSSTNMVVTNGAGLFIKYFATGNAAAFTFPVGETTGSTEYSPVTLDFATNAVAGTVGVRVVDAKDPNNSEPDNYITRYWAFTTATMTTYTYVGTFNYLAADVVGASESSFTANWWTGTAWNVDASSVTTAASDLVTTGTLSETTGTLNGKTFTSFYKDVYYWSKATGNWSGATVWEYSTTSADPGVGSGIATTVVPTYSNNQGITIRNGNNVTVDAGTYTADQMIIANGGTVTLGTNNFTIYSGTGTDLTIASGGTLATTTGQIVANAASATIDITGTVTTSDADGFSGTASTSISSANSPTVTLNAGSTVNYNVAAGGQTVTNITYSNLTLSNTSGTQTAAGAIVVNGTLTTTAGGTFDMSTFALTGTLSSVSNSGTIKTSCTSNPPLPTGKTWGGTVQYVPLTGGQTVADGTYSTITLFNTSGTNTASGAISVSTLLTTTAGGTLDMSTYALSGAGTMTNNGTIKTQNTTATPIPTGRTWAGTINYNAATGGQTVVSATSYTTLTLGNTSGTSTAAAATVVNTALNTTSGGTFDMSTFTLTGTLTTITNDGTIKTACTTNPPFTSGKTWGGSGKVEYTVLAGGQFIPAGTYNSLQLDNTSGTNTAAAAFTATTFTTAASGIIDMVTYALTTTTVNHSGYLKTQCTVDPPMSTGKTWGGTVEYNAAGNQTVTNGTYGHLIISTSGTKTLKGASTVTGNFTVSAGTFCDGPAGTGAYTLTVNGNIVMNGTHTTDLTTTPYTGGNITLSGGSGVHNISGSGSFYNLTMNDASYGAAWNSSMTVNGVLTLTNHNITLGANDLTLASSGGISGGSASSYIVTDGAGMLKRTVHLTGGTYNFPLGSATAYNPASIVWSGPTTGISRVDGKYTAATASTGTGLPVVSSSCLTASTLLDNGYWTFTETGTLTKNFNLSLTRNGETNASTSLQDHAIVRRNNSGTAWTDPGTWAVTTSAATTSNGQIGAITHTGLSSFGEFALAKGANSAPAVAAIGGGVATACVGTASATAFTDATAGGTWSITSGTGSATITSGGIVTGTAPGTITVNYTKTTGGDCSTTVTNTGTTVYDGGNAVATSTNMCSGNTTNITVSSYSGTIQWQDNTNSGGWVNGAGTNPTGVTYTTPNLTYPNSYQFRMLAQGLCPSTNTVTITPLEAATADPGVPTNYSFNSPSLILAKYKALCPDDYTFTQGLRNSRATIAIGQTVTVNFIAGTDATTMTGGTFNGTAIASFTVVSATQITFVTPVAVNYACPASTFTIVLNNITNPDYNLSGNATVSVANNSTGGLDTGTYPYATARHIGDYHDYDQSTVWNVAIQTSAGHCYTNLSAGTYCFEYTNPTSGPVKVGAIIDGGNSGCSPAQGGWASVSDATSGCATGGAAGGSSLFENSCTPIAGAGKAGACVTAGANYTMCVTIPVGCDGESFCPLLYCTELTGCGGGAINLPIELLYFDARLNKNKGIVELSWATATETNNDYFTLEKTKDANVYFDFKKVNGAGNSSSVIHYSAIDEHPFAGVSYYRLEQTDFDGKFSYSRLVAVNSDPVAKLGIKYVFADRYYNKLQYELNYANEKPLFISVIDVLGKTVANEKISPSTDGSMLYMDASGLSKGVYFFRVSDGDHVSVKKFIY